MPRERVVCINCRHYKQRKRFVHNDGAMTGIIADHLCCAKTWEPRWVWSPIYGDVIEEVNPVLCTTRNSAGDCPLYAAREDIADLERLFQLEGPQET